MTNPLFRCLRLADLRLVDTLVTGATGFVGGELVRSLLSSGVEPRRLRCLVRDPTRARGIPSESLRTGDLIDPAALRAAVDGVDVVFHLGGAIKALDRRGYDAANATGTANLVAALGGRAAAVRFVHVSSLAAAGPSVDGAGSNAEPAAGRPVSDYGRSKLDGERAVVASSTRWTIVRPPVVYGEGDAATRLLFRQALGLVCPVPPRPRPLSVVHVRDVVRALLAAAADAGLRRCFALDGPDRTNTHELLRRIAAACAQRHRLVRVPEFLASAAAGAADVWARCRGRAGFFSRDKVREIRAIGWVADGGPAREVLGFVPTVGLDDGLREVAVAEGLRRPAR